MSSEDRRNTVRHCTWFPVQVDAEGGNVLATAREVSERGILLATRRRIRPGQAVRLALHFDPGMQQPRELQGRIVRTLRNAGDPAALWSYKLAIEFQDPDPELVAMVFDDA